MAHTEQQITEGLTALAAAGGNSSHAVALLQAQDQIPDDNPDTAARRLRDWRDRYRNRYDEIAKRLGPQVEASLITTYRETALKATALTSDLIDRTRRQMDNDEIKDPSAAARNIATAGAILTDKMLVVDGRPNHINAPLDLDSVLAKLEALRLQHTHTPAIDSTATEEPQPQDVPLLSESHPSNAREVGELEEIQHQG